MAEAHDVIAAFADGERVDPDALCDALAWPEGRAYLADLLVLRGLVQAAGPDVDATASPRRSSRWLGLAAALVTCVAGGFAWGSQVTRLEPVTTRTTTTIGPATGDAPVLAPPATEFITLRPGVDWRESAGG
jgi:hypothetical protein